MPLTPCDAAAGRSGHKLPIDRGLASTHRRARLITGLLSAATLAVMSPPVAPVQAAGNTSRTCYLSHRAWTLMINGWGAIEKDRSNGEAAVGDGATLPLDTVIQPKGLGTHAPANILRACTSLMAGGVDDEKVAEGSVAFEAWTDGVEKYANGVITGSMPGPSIAVAAPGATGSP